MFQHCHSPSVLRYVHQRKLISYTTAASGIVLVLGILSAVGPSNTSIMWAFRGSSFLVLALAAAHLVHFALGRHNIGHWILAINLLLLRPDIIRRPHGIAGYDILIDLLLGMGVMLVVLDDSRVQVARLDVLNTITHEIAGAAQFGPMVEIVLAELKRITRAKAVWFRTLEGGTLSITVQIGLSPQAAEEIQKISADTPAGRALEDGTVRVLRSPDMVPEVRERVAPEGIRHLLVVPVQSKSSKIGVVILGMPGYRAYTENDKNFLKAAAKQLALAAENRGLVQQLVRSRNEWASTFNSIPDFILVHDQEYRILRANRALGRTGSRARTVASPKRRQPANTIPVLAVTPWFPPQPMRARRSPKALRFT